MERITLLVGQLSIVVTEEVVNKSRLYMYAPGLEIYVKGAVPLKRRDAVNHQCFEIALARKIPLISLRKP